MARLETLEVLPEADFHQTPVVAAPSNAPHASLLAYLSDGGHIGDDFRVTLTSQHRLTARFEGSAISPHLAFQNYTFEIEEDLNALVFQLNRMATRWADLDKMVASGAATAVSRDRDAPQFLELGARHKGDLSAPAAAI
jgi:hypothetical protein